MTRAPGEEQGDIDQSTIIMLHVKSALGFYWQYKKRRYYLCVHLIPYLAMAGCPDSVTTTNFTGKFKLVSL